MSATGEKFGKSASGEQVWLDAKKTSPYAFYQYWVRTDDRDVGNYLRYFTFLSQEEIADLDAATQTAPERRAAQTALAVEVTNLVHGPEATAGAQRATAALFSEDIAALEESLLLEVFADAPSLAQPRAAVTDGSFDIASALAEAGLVKSKGEARRAIEQGGAYVNNRKYTGDAIGVDDLLHDRFLVLRRGKRDFALVRFDA